MIKYEYLEVGDPILIQSKIIDDKLKSIEEKQNNISLEKVELENMKAEITQQASELILRKKEVEILENNYKEKIDLYNDYQNRVQTLASWIASSTPEKITKSLQEDIISIELIVDALYLLQPSIAGEILNAMSDINPNKAAQIIVKLGEKRGGSVE
eukprot:TRINITY_DN10576_c0_g1_i1.p1 TRINITY_DN10576_c0_g1~~TRINITY_DN10576_c0_g1_i1.p1  ORF type:complete len:163 (+),score=43.85 TRINITY_DN10576_c0_g1_i1:24-491(+)